MICTMTTLRNMGALIRLAPEADDTRYNNSNRVVVDIIVQSVTQRNNDHLADFLGFCIHHL